MIITTIISLVLIFLTVIIHYRGLCWVACASKEWDTGNFIVPPALMFFIALLHLFEIVIYAIVFFLMYNHTDLGGFTEQFKPDLWNYLYFSGANYTTLGMSNFYPTGHFKILSFTEALNGFMMLTWSATFFYATAGRFFKHDNEKENY